MRSLGSAVTTCAALETELTPQQDAQVAAARAALVALQRAPAAEAHESPPRARRNSHLYAPPPFAVDTAFPLPGAPPPQALLTSRGPPAALPGVFMSSLAELRGKDTSAEGRNERAEAAARYRLELDAQVRRAW